VSCRSALGALDQHCFTTRHSWFNNISMTRISFVETSDRHSTCLPPSITRESGPFRRDQCHERIASGAGWHSQSTCINEICFTSTEQTACRSKHHRASQFSVLPTDSNRGWMNVAPGAFSANLQALTAYWTAGVDFSCISTGRLLPNVTLRAANHGTSTKFHNDFQTNHRPQGLLS
jgi:hypothetical protein